MAYQGAGTKRTFSSDFKLKSKMSIGKKPVVLVLNRVGSGFKKGVVH